MSGAAGTSDQHQYRPDWADPGLKARRLPGREQARSLLQSITGTSSTKDVRTNHLMAVRERN